MELVIVIDCKAINYDYQVHCVATVQLQLQFLQKYNKLQLITITNYHYNILAESCCFCVYNSIAFGVH